MLLLGTIPGIILKLEVDFRNVKLNDQTTDLHQTTIDFNLPRKFTLKNILAQQNSIYIQN